MRHKSPKACVLAIYSLKETHLIQEWCGPIAGGWGMGKGQSSLTRREFFLLPPQANENKNIQYHVKKKLRKWAKLDEKF